MKKLILILVMCIGFTFPSYANYSLESEVVSYIESLDKSDLQAWFIEYKSIQQAYSDVIDSDETIHDYVDENEFNFLCDITEAEISNGNFIQKVNVASAIVNRYRSPNFPNTFTKVLKQKIGGHYQFTPFATEAYKKFRATEETKMAVEFAFQIADTVQGSTYYCSGKSKWHEKNLEFVFNDGKHNFYREK